MPRGKNCNTKGSFHPFLYPVHFPRTEILPHIGNHRIAVRSCRHFQNPIKFIGGRKPGDKNNPESIYDCLDYHPAAAIAACMLVSGKGILACFISGEPQEVEMTMGIAYHYLSIMSVCLPILYILHVIRSALQGMGDTLLPMVSGIAEFIMPKFVFHLFIPASIVCIFILKYQSITVTVFFQWTKQRPALPR